MQEIDFLEAINRWDEVLDQIENGKEFQITRDEKIVAKFVPPDNFDQSTKASLSSNKR